MVPAHCTDVQRVGKGEGLTSGPEDFPVVSKGKEEALPALSLSLVLWPFAPGTHSILNLSLRMPALDKENCVF